MAIKVGINGYGRIGRNTLRALYEAKRTGEIQIVAVNDLGNANTNAHLTRYDTAHGKFNGTVTVDGDSIVVNGDRIKVLSERDPSKLPWGQLGVDVVFECTGIFTSKAKASAHLAGGAKRVLISAPGGSDVDGTVVYGVNHDTLTSAMTVVSNASCTTNCLAPLAKVLNDAIGIESGLMTTIHAYTNDQVLTDVYHEDLRRRGRGPRAAAAQGQARRLRHPRAHDQRVGGRSHLQAEAQHHGRGDQLAGEGGREWPAEGRAGLHRRAAGLGGLQPRSGFFHLRRHAHQDHRRQPG